MDDDLPLLGEAPAVELANTRYGTGADAIDFLADPATAARWVAEVTDVGPVDDLSRLRELRDAVYALLEARCANRPPDPTLVAIVNRHAADGDAAVALSCADGVLTSRVVFRGPARVRASFATSCAEVLIGSAPVRRCEGPGCSLFFVAHHGRRRFCHDGCSHRGRQQRYRRNSP